MAGRTDTDYGLVPVKSRVSLSSRPVPPSYNKGRESNLTKQKNSIFFLDAANLECKSVKSVVIYKGYLLNLRDLRDKPKKYLEIKKK